MLKPDGMHDASCLDPLAIFCAGQQVVERMALRAQERRLAQATHFGLAHHRREIPWRSPSANLYDSPERTVASPALQTKTPAVES